MRMKSITGQEVHVALVETGHATRIGTDWTEVHPRFQMLAMSKGCVPEYYEPPSKQEEIDEVRKVESIQDLIIKAITKMKAEPLDGYFTQEGLPNLKKLSVVAGFEVKREQMIEAVSTMALAKE